MPKAFTKDEFISKAKNIHGDKYDYSLVKYVNMQTKVSIICPIHGQFEQTPAKHLLGRGCRKCAGNEKLTKDEFISKAKNVHGEKYNYDIVNYINAKTKVDIICPTHGVFSQIPDLHLSGKGCPKCGGKFCQTQDEFISRAKLIHGDKYDYSKVKYIRSYKKVDIICPIHGLFSQTPNNHLHGYGCLMCSNTHKSSTKEFISKAKEIHGDKYDYSKVEYVSSQKPVIIICKEHGEFEQKPIHHLQKCGCPNCNKSKSESEIKLFLEQNHIKYVEQKKFSWLKSKRNMSLDFFLPYYNIAIECQGRQHFLSIDHFGGENSLQYIINHDAIKKELCENHGIKIFYFANYKFNFPYKVYTNKDELLKDINLLPIREINSE